MSERGAGRGLVDAAIAFGIRVASAGLVFALQVLLARLMPLEGYGGFVTLWTWLLALGSFGALGFAESSVRFVPRYHGRGRTRQVEGFWRYGFGLVVIGSCAMALLALLLALALGAGAPPGLIVLFVAIGLPFLALEYYLEGIARSFGWFRLTTVPVYILRPLLIGGVCVTLHLAGVALTLTVVGLVIVGSMAAITTGLALAIARRLGPRRHAAPSPASRALWLRASLPLLLVSGLEDLLTYSDVLILSLMVPAEDVGVYFAAARTLALANFVYYAMYLVSGRRFALDLAGPDRGALQASVLEAAAVTFWLTLGAVAATLAAGPLLLAAFGAEFSAGYPVMVLLGAGFVARALAGQAAEVLIVGGRQREIMAVAGGVLAVGVGLSVVLVPVVGILGAAIGTGVAMACRTLALALVVRRTMGLRTISLGLKRRRAASVP